MLFYGTLLSFVLLAVAGNCKVKETVGHPHGWAKLRPAPKDYMLKLRIGLPQVNFAELERHLYEVSDPDHERYGQHLSKEEVEALVAPEDESVRLVDEWLAEHGFPTEALARSPAQDWVTISVPVHQAEKMLDTEYHVWEHAKSGERIVRTLSYGIPEHLHNHIDVVQPTTVFTRMRALRSTVKFFDEPENKPAPGFVKTSTEVTVDPSCNTTITPTCLDQLYNAVGYTPSADNGNAIGITGYLEEFVNNADLEEFFTNYRPKAVGSNYTTVSINGGLNNQTLDEAGAEANLDSQYAFSLTFPTPRFFYTTGGSPPFKPDADTPENDNEPYTEFLDFILGQEHPAQTISSSYGDDEQTVPESFAKRVCAGFAQLGARGVSLTVSSGDGGVGDGDSDPATQECFTNDGRNVTRFIPLFPASCPYVTGVGGTVNVPEVAVTRFFSGGGFSNYFDRPSYQDSVVPAYLLEHAEGLKAYHGLFNPAGRAIPDVAAQGDNFVIFLAGELIKIGGTSAASPTFASIVSLLNDALISAKKRPLGFLNPLLYSKGVAGLNDITIGHNSGCGTTGFNASKGWDPVTGLGTPNFEKLKSIIFKSPLA